MKVFCLKAVSTQEKVGVAIAWTLSARDESPLLPLRTLTELVPRLRGRWRDGRTDDKIKSARPDKEGGEDDETR